MQDELAEGEVPAAAPQWTDMEETRGLDPLGMQSLCVSLYQSLLPGISNVTLRIRYYGLYAWLSSRYAQDLRNTSSAEWQRYIRRAEALYALAVRHANQNEGGIAGSRWASRLLREGVEVMEFHPATDRLPGVPQYLKQAMGAFGAAYGSQLFAIGVLTNAGKHKVPVPTEVVGQHLAAAFARAIGDAADRFLHIAARGTVTTAELDSLAFMSPSKIQDGPERDAYESILFVRAARGDDDDARRRRTLELVLHLTARMGRLPRSDDLRWSAYSGRTLTGALLDLPTQELETQRFSWSVYHGNDLLHIAYETLLKHALQTLARYPAGLTPEALEADVVGGLMDEWGSAPRTWRELEDQTDLADNPWSEADETSECNLTQAALAVSAASTQCEADTAKDAVTLLAVLSKRFTAVEEKYFSVLGQSAQNEVVHSLRSELRFLRDHEDEPLAAMLRKLLRNRILERHLWVAFQKLNFQKDYTFLIESQEGRLRTRQLDGPVSTNPRLEPAIGFLQDLSLVDQEGLTSRGQAVLEHT